MQLHDYFDQPAAAQRKKGRNPELVLQRDRKLAARFYWYAKLRRMNYRDTVSALVQEFDISDRVVLDRLRANQDYLDWLFESHPGKQWLQRNFPYFRW